MAVTCEWHRVGPPRWALGQNWREPGCPVCDAKLAAGKITATAPTMAEFSRANRPRHHGPWINNELAARQELDRRLYYASHLRPPAAGNGHG